MTDLSEDTVTATKCWRESHGFIYFSVSSDEWTTGGEWITRLQLASIRINESVENIFNNSFPIIDRATINVAAVKSEFLASVLGENFSLQDILSGINRIWEEDKKNDFLNKSRTGKLVRPGIEFSPLIRKGISDGDLASMGLDWLIIMHEPVDVGAGPRLFGISRCGSGNILSTIPGNYDYKCSGSGAFVFKIV